MTDAEYMMDLFRGSDLAHGRSEVTDVVTTKGKRESKSWTEKRPATLRDWELHLAGEAGLGIPPLNSNNQAQFGAVDVDVYNGLDIVKLNATIQEAKLPLVVCRSKSGGPHLYLFLKEPVPATEMIEKMDSLAGYLGFGTSEIFPKQAMISRDAEKPDFGSWINMPYFGGTRFLRYALDAEGKAIVSIPNFRAYVEERRLTAEQFRALKTPEPAEIFPDGPPCLNHIFANKPTDLRNVLLGNAAVYAKKAFPENWQAKVDEYNRLFPEPLGSAEVETLKKSYGKKDYRYQCSKQPLCNYCDSSRCRKTAHGVGGGEFLPATRSLSMVDTSPPIWYLDIVRPQGPTRISLTTEQLQDPRLFQRRCMETIQQMPPTIKMEEWQPIVSQLMQHCTKIEVPPEMTPTGQFIEHLWEFLHARASDGSFQDLLRGVPFCDGDHYYFRLKDLQLHLAQQRFVSLKPNEIIAVLRSTLNATKEFKHVGGRGVNCFKLPAQNPQPMELATPQFQEAY